MRENIEWLDGYRCAAGNLLDGTSTPASLERLYSSDPTHETEFGRGVITALADWKKMVQAAQS